MLTLDDIPWHRIDTRWLYISSLGGDMELMRELITYATDNDIKVAVNPGKSELKKPELWQGLFRQIDVFIVNKEEAELLSQDQPLSGPHIICITDGKQGGQLFVDGKTQSYSSKIVPTVEETGAGDAFGSGFVAALISGQSSDVAVKWGVNQAASVVSFMGAKRGLLTQNDISKI